MTCVNVMSSSVRILQYSSHLIMSCVSRSGDTAHHDWNRPAGRPWTTWMSQIVRDTGLTAADAWALGNDRSTWRAL